jgi:hypothetical protein
MLSFTSQGSANENRHFDAGMRSSRIPQPSPTNRKTKEHEKQMKQHEQQQPFVGTPSRQQQKQGSPVVSSPRPRSPLPMDEEVDLTDLLRFMERREWMCVVRFFEQHSRAPEQKTPLGNLPLHEALKHHPPLPVINLLLELNPFAARQVGAHGYLPLHVACLCRTIKADVVGRLVAAHPAALRTREPQKDGLPLHLAVQTGASEEVLMELLTNYPEASFVQDGAGKIPLDYANESCHHHNRSIVALETAPVLLAAAQAAQARVAREYDRKMDGLREAHNEYTRQLEGRFHTERADFVRKEIEFADNLTYEKERNIALAEMVLEMKNIERSLRLERDALQERLDEEVAELRSLMETQDREFRTLLEGTAVTRLRDGGHEGGNRRSREVRASASGDADREPTDHNDLAHSSRDGQPLGILLENLARGYEELKAENVGLKEQLEYKEDMVRHLNELLSSKDEEIPRLNQRVHELESSHEEAKERTVALEGMHEATLQRLTAMRDEVHDLKQTKLTLQSQLQESRRKLRTQENRLGSIKSLVTSLNFNMENWLDEEAWRGEALKAEGKTGKNEDDDDEDGTYPSTVEDVDTSGPDPSSSSGSVMEEREDEEGHNLKNEFMDAARINNENSTSFDTVTGTTVVVTHVERKLDVGRGSDELVRGIHKATSYETTTTNTTTPTYMDSPSYCDKSAMGAETRSVNSPVPQSVERKEECGEEVTSMSVGSNLSSLHRTFTDCGLPSNIISP